MRAANREDAKALDPVVLIPAYKPDARLPQLVERLRERGMDVLVVDDGGGASYAPFFERCAELGARVVRHAVNLGKGRALKTGLNELMLHCPGAGVITADADGQHTTEDIHKVAQALGEYPAMLIVGGRAFTGNVPWKSRAGNALTRAVYFLATGARIHDTQTGLRGIPASALPWMAALQGERYEYEMNMLLKLRDFRLRIMEVPIDTVYIDRNAGSHFRALRDGLRVYGVILRYMIAALLSFGVDYALYLWGRRWIGMVTPEGLLPFVPAISYIAARLCSSLLNYTLNKRTVFGNRGGRSSLWKYYALAVSQMLLGAGLTSLTAHFTHVPEGVAKLPVDALLFCASFFVQRDFVFRVQAPEENA